jgi:hypothetical protein
MRTEKNITFLPSHNNYDTFLICLGTYVTLDAQQRILVALQPECDVGMFFRDTGTACASRISRPSTLIAPHNSSPQTIFCDLECSKAEFDQSKKKYLIPSLDRRQIMEIMLLEVTKRKCDVGRFFEFLFLVHSSLYNSRHFMNSIRSQKSSLLI